MSSNAIQNFQQFLEANKPDSSLLENASRKSPQYKFLKKVSKSEEILAVIKEAIKHKKITYYSLGFIKHQYPHTLYQWTFSVATLSDDIYEGGHVEMPGCMLDTLIVIVNVNKYGYVSVAQCPCPGMTILGDNFPCSL
jgi:hypothetical protein